MRRRGVAAALAVAVWTSVVALATPAAAQRSPSDPVRVIDREDARPPPPAFADPTARPDLELPEIVVPPQAPAMELERGFVLRGVAIDGATVFDSRVLAEAVAPFLDREVRPETLLAITDTITRLYVDVGYVSSGAIVPEQDVEAGVLRIQVVEGVIADLDVETSGRLRPGWVEARVQRALEAPFSLPRLDETLRVLQLDPRVDRVDAVVVPSSTLGETRLRLRVEEARAWVAEGRAANDLAPALGGQRITGFFEHLNVSGFGDTFTAVTSGAQGLIDAEVAYRVPVGPWLTEIEVRGSYAEGAVVKGPFSDVDFRNEVASYGVALIQPIWRDPVDEVRLIASVERRTSELAFGPGGDPLALEVNGADGDVVRLFLLRLDADWVHREIDRAFSARLRATFGLDAWDASSPNATSILAPPGQPLGARRQPTFSDAEFQAMLMQLQYAQRIDTPFGPGEVIARGDLQLASGSLFSLEAFAMGGSTTVRGYTENATVADNGTLASLELRVPVVPSTFRPHELRLAPFVDIGHAWNDDDDQDDHFDDTFASVGLGLLYDHGQRFSARAWWGHRLTDRLSNRDEALQRNGFHLEATLRMY